MKEPGSRDTGVRRIRLVAAVVAAVVFGMTAVEQFRGEALGATAFGVLVSAIAGFGSVWIVVTMIGWVLRIFRSRG